MEKTTQEMILVGYHHFNSKDKKQIYYVVQCLYNENDLSKANCRGTMLNIFVDDDTYQKVSSLEIGTPLKVELTPNVSNGKIYYKVVM